MQQYLQQDIQFLPGVGPKRADLLRQELNINTVEDLLTFYPYRYVDRSRFYKISEVRSEMPFIQIKGKIQGYTSIGKGRGKRLVADFTDGSGHLELVWFRGAKWIPENYPVGKELVVFGRPSVYQRKLNVIHPELEDPEKKHVVSSRLQAVYSSTEKLKDNYLTSKAISKLMANLIKGLPRKFEETLPAWLLQKLNLINLNSAMRQIHFPDASAEYKTAELRLKFEELFYIQLNILQGKTERNRRFRGNIFETVGLSFNSFYKEHLHFELTGAQKKVMKEIRRDMGSGRQMNRLLQGDVGSGKTLVALMSMLIAIDNGFQACIMAPTEILAQQHFKSISSFLDGMDLRVELLTGSVKKAVRIPILEGLLDGSLHILIGTHAVIVDVVLF